PGAYPRKTGDACLLRETRHSISDLRIAEWLGGRIPQSWLVGALRRGNSRDWRGFVAALAPQHERADRHGQRESQQGTIAEQRQWSQPFAEAKTSAINPTPRLLVATH